MGRWVPTGLAMGSGARGCSSWLLRAQLRRFRVSTDPQHPGETRGAARHWGHPGVSAIFFPFSNANFQAHRLQNVCGPGGHITLVLGTEPCRFAQLRASAASTLGLGTDTRHLPGAIFLLENKFAYSNPLLP